VAREPAVVILGGDGRYLDANAEALDMLGVTLEQLLAATPSMFSAEPVDVDAGAALRREWERAGGPDLTGETTIRRPDGQLRHVRFVITRRDAGFAAILEPASTAAPTQPAEPHILFTTGDVLAEWRAAERRLEAVPADSPEWQATQAQIASLRDRYQRLFAARRG